MVVTAVYQACCECGQEYPTAADLLDAHNQILAADGLAAETRVELVVTCPACVHDFAFLPRVADAVVTDRRDLAGGLVGEAAVIANRLRENGFDPAQAVNRQVLGLAEEVGEFVGAYRRWSGQARRAGTVEEVHTELADMIITAFVTAHELGVDIQAVIAAKLDTIHTRGWREHAPGACDCRRRGRGRCPVHHRFAIGAAKRAGRGESR